MPSAVHTAGATQPAKWPVIVGPGVNPFFAAHSSQVSRRDSSPSRRSTNPPSSTSSSPAATRSGRPPRRRRLLRAGPGAGVGCAFGCTGRRRPAAAPGRLPGWLPGPAPAASSVRAASRTLSSLSASLLRRMRSSRWSSYSVSGAAVGSLWLAFAGMIFLRVLAFFSAPSSASARSPATTAAVGTFTLGLFSFSPTWRSFGCSSERDACVAADPPIIVRVRVRHV
mmetsp:Transcript_19147/g.47450  ORF Transcript_19147/g.47450 Transcript_19147/m.47450 type:complete len:225 (+) Transcript_19147:2551-3225(+)